MLPSRWRLGLASARLMRLAMFPTTQQVAAPFVLLAKQRSGSTWVIDLLNSHPQMIAFSELFLDDAWGHPAVGGDKSIRTWNSYGALHPGHGRWHRTKLYFRYLDEEVHCARDDGRAAAGYKLMYNQAASAFAIPLYLMCRNVRVVHLIRRNHLDAVLSAEAVKLRRRAHSVSGVAVEAVRVDLEAHSLVGRLAARGAEVEVVRREFSGLGVPYCELFYEDLLADRAEISEVLEFLGVDADATALSSQFSRLNTTSHRELLKNYDDIACVLAGTRFEDLLRSE